MNVCATWQNEDGGEGMLVLALKQMKQISASFILTSNYKISYAQHLSGTSLMLNIFDTSVMFAAHKTPTSQKRCSLPSLNVRTTEILGQNMQTCFQSQSTRWRNWHNFAEILQSKYECVSTLLRPPWRWYDFQMEDKTSTSKYAIYKSILLKIR